MTHHHMPYFAVYQRCNQVTAVRYSHLDEQQAQDEADRLNSNCQARGIPSYAAHAWIEEHSPDHTFLIGS